MSTTVLNDGHWVIQKTKNRFSAMSIDQAHEQNNALVKGSGGAIGLMQNPVAFRKWLLAGPEQARELDMGIVMDESVVDTVRTIEALGKEQFNTGSYYKSVLVDCTSSIHNPKKRNNLLLFKSLKQKSKSKQSKIVENLKNDVSLFS